MTTLAPIKWRSLQLLGSNIRSYPENYHSCAHQVAVSDNCWVIVSNHDRNMSASAAYNVAVLSDVSSPQLRYNRPLLARRWLCLRD